MNFDLMYSKGFANSGGYFILKKDGSISHTNEKPENITIIDKKYVEELLFRNALEVIQSFAKTEDNMKFPPLTFLRKVEVGVSEVLG